MARQNSGKLNGICGKDGTVLLLQSMLRQRYDLLWATLETQEITGNHITQEQQLQNMRLATHRNICSRKIVNTQYLAGKHWTPGTGNPCCTANPGIRMNQIMYRNSTAHNGSWLCWKIYEAKAAQFHAPVQRRIKYQKNRTDKLPGTAVEKYNWQHRNMCKQKRDVPMQRSNKQPILFKKYRFRTGR